MGALEDLVNTPDPQPQSGGSALEALANSPDTSGSTQATPGQNLLSAVKGEDTHLPLTSHDQATRQGVLNVIQSTSQAVQGAYQAVRHPIDTAKGLVQSAKDAPGQIGEIPGAIRDINASPDPTGTYLDVAEKTAAQGAGQAIVALGTEGLRVTGAKAVKAVKNLRDVPAALSTDTSSTLATIAHNDGLPPLQATDARGAAAEIQKAYVNKAKDFYAPVDKAVEGNLKPVQERISQLKQAYDYQKDVNPELADKQLTELGQQYQKLGQLVEKAKAAGVPNAEQLMAQGDAYYTKGMAMKEVSSGIKTASGFAKMDGHPHPTLFANQIDKLYNKGTLTRALGEDGAKAMLDTAKTGYSKGKTVSAIKSVAKKSIPYVAGGAALGAAGVGVAKSLSGE